MSGQRIQVIERAIDIVDALMLGPATLTEIAERTGLPKGTAFRILSSLVYEGHVVKDPIDSHYMLGPGMWRIAQALTDGVSSVSTSARPALVKLRETTDETITLSVRMGLHRVCIVELRSPLPLLYAPGVGSQIPLHVGASSKVLLAFMEPAELARLAAGLTYERLTAATILDAETLTEELARVRARGWAESLGERLAGAAGISVPVRVAQGFVLSLSVLGPADRLTSERRQEVLPALERTARAIERAALPGLKAFPVSR